MSFPTIYIDINTGAAQRSDGSALPPFRFFLNDIIATGIVFVDGSTVVTGATLAGPATMRLGIKSLGADSALLASALTYNLAGNVAAVVFNLATTQFAAYFVNSVGTQNREARFLFEIEVTSADGTIKQTYHQSVCTVIRDVNTAGDVTPTPSDANLYVQKTTLFDGNSRGITWQFVNFRGELTTAADVRAIPTANLTKPCVFDASFADDDRRYKLRARAGGENDDGNFFLVPADYDVVTNPVIFIRTR